MRTPRAGLVVLAALVLPIPLSPCASAREANGAPVVVPSLRQWDGGTGALTLTSASRVVAAAENARALAQRAADDIAADGGPRLAAVVGTPEPGDVALRLDAPDAGAEGYRLEVTDRVTIRAREAAGAFYGTRTLLQMLRADPARRSVARGRAEDGPRFSDRGQMLDVGRKHFPIAYLKAQIQRMGWYKLNRFHLHLNDWNGFRVQSDRFPGLAAPESYTKAEIRDLQEYAARHHVTIVPEIDLPAHAVAISRYDPGFAFACRSMSYPSLSLWEGADRGGWTLDVTRPRTRAFVKTLLDEMIPLFRGREFHIGGDEVPPPRDQDRCPELVAYQKARGYPYAADVFVEFMNDLNAQVRAHGKTAQAWTGWDEGQKTSIVPDKDIQIVDWKASVVDRAEAGYQMVGAQDGVLYVAPGWARQTAGLYGRSDPKDVYEKYAFPEHPNIRGYRLARWSDRAHEESPAWFDFWARRSLQALADRTWGGPRETGLPAFLDRVDRVGDAPPGAPTLLSQTGWRVVSVSGQETVLQDGAARNAIDNDPATLWHTPWLGRSLPAEIVIDLGASRSLGGWRHQPRQDGVNGRVARYELQVSDDPDRWGEPVASGAFPDDELDRPVAFSRPVTGRYVRLRVLAEHGPTGAYASMAEIDLWTAGSDGRRDAPSEAPSVGSP
ncbi:family 20 glycosylhydrolase [Spirillospora sp. CA-294931]|uniref:family 20 glycosylhydrolase n=1 Tax=Spirillospora sp. CA-294931 TaxID=3240042 RepID=UPI003D9144D6